ncbi:hypothetical protein M0805_006816 [Coniferiporia weirii]|nr:hypothetical protein M0805_006816 [Coniferiporia weirii]
MSVKGKSIAFSRHVEDAEKDLYSLQSTVSPGGPVRGIDAEVAQFFENRKDEIVIDDATNRRLRWMVHKRVLVVMVLTYFLQALDKGTINFASIMGIVQDTHLVGNQYAWLTTCVYIAILVWELPSNRLLQRLPIGKYLGFNIMMWGAVLACTAACKNFAGLVTVRTFLGIFECVCQPAFVFLSTMWYTREEQGLAIGAFYACNGFQQMVGGLLAYGVAHIEGQSLKNWQILFLLLGCITVVWGIFVMLWLPDSPMKATCWSDEDKHLIAERVRKNQTGIQNKEFKKYQAVEALSDPTVWAVTLTSFTNGLPTGGIGAFGNIILSAFGFSQLQIYLLAIAQGAVIVTFLFSAAWLAKRYKQRLLVSFIYTLPNVAGTIVFLTVRISAHTKVGLLLAFYCCNAFAAVATLNLAAMSGNIAGRTKQVIATTLVFVAWAVGNAVGPQVFLANDGPRYIKAWTSHIVIYAVQLAAIVFLRARLMRLNVLKRRAQGLAENKVGGEDAVGEVSQQNAFADLTDYENPDCELYISSSDVLWRLSEEF